MKNFLIFLLPAVTVGRAWILKRPQTRMNTTFLLSFLIRASVHVSVVNQITFNFLLDFSVPVAYNQGTRPISCWFSVRPARLHPDGAFAISRTPATAGRRRWGRAPAGYRSACSSGRSPLHRCSGLAPQKLAHGVTSVKCSMRSLRSGQKPSVPSA